MQSLIPSSTYISFIPSPCLLTDFFCQNNEEPESEEGSEEEESEDENAAGPSASNEPLSRAERKEQAKARKEAAAAKARAAAGGNSDSDSDEDDEPARPSAAATVAKKGQAGIKVSNPNDPGNASTGLSRREREALEAAAAKERYWKLQEAGKTDQAKADLARLQVIRREREEKAKMRKAEMEEKAAAAAAKAAASGRRK
jgi:hypothetical protein